MSLSNVTVNVVQNQPSLRLGWIGLGSMGISMAKTLQKHLSSIGASPLSYTNRTLSRGAALEALGGLPCQTLGQVMEKSDIIFLSISNDSVLENLVNEIIASSNKIEDKIIVDTSTVHPDTSVSAAAKLSKLGASFVAAPVSGTPPVAEAGELLFMVAGPSSATRAIAPFLKGVMGREVIQLGEDVSKSSLLKTSANFIFAAMLETISEAHVFAEKTGLGNETMETLIWEDFGPLAHSISKRLTTGAYEPPRDGKPGSDLNLAIKDVGHGITCAEKAGTRLKLAEVALDHYRRAKTHADADGGRPLDSSSMYGIIRQDAGLDFETDLVKKRDD